MIFRVFAPKINRTASILLYGANLGYLGEGMFGPFIALFTEKVGGDVLNISWAAATYFLVTGFMMIVVGKLSDIYNKEGLMLIGVFMAPIFTFSYILVQSPAQLLLVQAGLGVASALSTPTWNSLYAKHEDKRKSGFLWGLAGGEFQITSAIAIILGGIILTNTSFEFLFMTMGTIQFTAALYQLQILRKK